jgi:2-polyprenyl-6-methoxyphenol hydroxylase-like FAD-dependent oxidoreductase
MKVLIAGAGIGGLTLALMLQRRGIAAEIYEQASEVRELGVGINTLPVAIGELAELGLLPALDRAGIRTRELIYLNRLGQEVWRELRGLDGGNPAPQLSIHRGRLQKVLYDAVSQRLGPDAVRTGLRLAGLVQGEGGVTVHLVSSADGLSSMTVRGDVLVCADGIHSAGRALFYPKEGAPSWNGVMMWRGATVFPQFLDGRTMIIGGGMGAKFVLYPIADAEDGRKLTNWVVNVRVADGATAPPPKESWSKRARLEQVLPYARRFAVPGFDIEALVRATEAYYEYPMCDRDPLPRWSFGRVTLLGDAAHPMYPVGSNGASQAVLDARCLAEALAQSEHPMQALYRYEQERLAKTAAIVRANRKGGPERVIDEVEKRAPAGFADVEQVLSHAERRAIVAAAMGLAPTPAGAQAERAVDADATQRLA